MKIVFIGGTRRGYMTLKALLENGRDVAGIISLAQDDHETDRCEPAMRQLAGQYGIPLYETKRLKDRDYPGIIAGVWRADLGIVTGCRILLPRDVYESAPMGMIAAHDSLLPAYRGFAPLNWAIINGEDRTGVTVFYVAERMDAGDMVCRKAVPIAADDDACRVYERVCEATVQAVLEACAALESGTATRTPQDEAAATYTCCRIPADGMIEWSRSTREIYNLVRGLAHPYPGAWTWLRDKRMTVWRAAPLENAPRYAGRIPGRVVRIDSGGEVHVLTGDGILRLLEVQLESEERKPAAQVVRSIRLSLGLDTTASLKRIAELETNTRDNSTRTGPAGSGLEHGGTGGVIAAELLESRKLAG